MMFEIVLVVLIVCFIWLLMRVRPAKGTFKKCGLKGDIALKDLSTLWVQHNNSSESGDVIGSVSDEKPEEFADEEELQAECDDTDDFGINAEAVLKELARIINIANDKGIREVFSLGGIVYVHTSGLNRVIRELTGESDKEVIKEQAELIVKDFTAQGLTHGFIKYEWADQDGRRGKSVYMPISAEIFTNMFGLVITDSSKIASMKAEEKIWKS